MSVQASITSETVAATHTVSTATISIDISRRTSLTVLAAVAMWCADLWIGTVLEWMR